MADLVVFAESAVINSSTNNMPSVKMQVACLIIVTFILVIYFFSEHEKGTSNKIFFAILIAGIINLIFDITTVYTVNHWYDYDTGVYAVLNRLFHSVFIGSLDLIMFLLFIYIKCIIRGKDFLKGPKYIKIITVIPIILALGTTIFGELHYNLHPKSNYYMGFVAYVCYTVLAIYLIFTLVTVLVNYRKFPTEYSIFIIVSLTTQLAVAIVQGIYPWLLISGLGTTIVVISSYLTIENPGFVLLSIQKEQAEEANRAKSNFISNVSHELRTPINAVLGMNEMILRECKDISILQYSSNIKVAGNNLLHIINDILDFTKVEAGKVEIVNGDYDLTEMLFELYDMIAIRAKDKGLNFIVCVHPHCRRHLHGDSQKIKQIIINLLTNAVKYTNYGYVEITVSTTMLEENKAILNVAVKDSGIGIKQEDMAHLFNSFERLEKERNRNIEGTGLGLALTSALISLLGGKIEVQSEYGVGSQFSISVTQSVLDNERVGDFNYQNSHRVVDIDSYHEAFTAPNAKMLVVDDNEQNLFVVESLLKNTKIQISTATNGKECLNRVRIERFDLILLDHMMPHMDGIQTIDKIREEGLCEGVPIIAYTANALDTAIQLYKEHGFADYLLKPAHGKTLEILVQKYLKPKLIEPAKDTDKEEEPLLEKNESGHSKEYLLKFGFNLDEAMKNCGGNGQLFNSLCAMFVKNVPKAIAKLFEECSYGDTDSYAVDVHSLKTNARTIGAMKLAETAYAHELSAKNGDTSYIKDKFPELKRQADETVNILRAYLN